jgi:hypothetical protein
MTQKTFDFEELNRALSEAASRSRAKATEAMGVDQHPVCRTRLAAESRDALREGLGVLTELATAIASSGHPGGIAHLESATVEITSAVRLSACAANASRTEGTPEK